MKKYLSIVLAAITILFNSCTNGQTQSSKTNLSATEFADKIKELPTAPIVDVRTPDEFSKGHLVNALNYDWNGSEFDKQIALLDKSKPVFVYCLSGGRSSSAASRMRSDGFKEVYELSGGIMKWRGVNLPETTENTVVSNGMSKQQFDALLLSSQTAKISRQTLEDNFVPRMLTHLLAHLIFFADTQINAKKNQKSQQAQTQGQCRHIANLTR